MRSRQRVEFGATLNYVVEAEAAARCGKKI